MTASGRPTPRRSAEAAARRSSLEGFRTPGQFVRTRTWDRAQLGVLFPGPESHASARGQPGVLPGGRGGEAPGLGSVPPPRAPLPTPRPLSLPPARPSATPHRYLELRGQRGPRLREGSGRRGESVLSARFRFAPRLRLQARQRSGTNGLHSRGGRPLCDVIRPRRLSAGPAGFPRSPRPHLLPSGLRAPAPVRPRPLGARPPSHGAGAAGAPTLGRVSERAAPSRCEEGCPAARGHVKYWRRFPPSRPLFARPGIAGSRGVRLSTLPVLLKSPRPKVNPFRK